MATNISVRGTARKHFGMIFLALLLSTPLLAQTPPAPDGAFSAAVAQDSDLTLRFTTPDGKIYLKLVRDSNGPVEMPVKGATVSALQISTRFEPDGTLRVGIHGVGDDQLIYPVSAYDFTLPSMTTKVTELSAVEEQRIELGELESLGLRGWTLQLSAPPPPTTNADSCGCCSCGWLSCCPNAGHCLVCSPCGSCCCAGPGDKPKPAQQW